MIAVEKTACINFWKTNNLTGILTDFSIVSDCKIVDIPPKLTTNEHIATARCKLPSLDNESAPLVISTMPSKKAETLAGKNEKIGEKHSITMKKIVMMQPTERIDSVEFVTTSARLNFCGCSAFVV